ncbi:helix-turn-helix transcriptional regulator [Chitinophaga sp.]|uniref:helix-turn-helix transcriptional regulator n=1 Tax=Chitinophaga sp. TaxID=1869181 RepID=UPI0031D32CCF
MELYQSDHLLLRYNESLNLFQGTWKACDTAETFIEGIKTYKEVFEKTVPEKIVWDETGFSFTIPPDLQQWTYEFLDKPAGDKGIDYKVAHIVGPDVLASVSIMEMYTDGKTSFTPRFFSHEHAALNWMESGAPSLPPASGKPEWTVNRFPEEGKARITIDIDLNDLPQYLLDFKQILRSRKFHMENYTRFLQLTARERLVLSLLLKGHGNKQIADRLAITCDTAKTHRKNMLRKLGCRNMAELMMYKIFF